MEAKGVLVEGAGFGKETRLPSAHQLKIAFRASPVLLGEGGSSKPSKFLQG